MASEKNMNPLSISVVIPNYNGMSLLEANIPSVYAALKKANIDYEIIVSDDASTDDSIIFLKKNYPDIKIIENKKNKGFSPTANMGVFAATKDLVFALNSDVKLTEDYFTPQLKYFTKEDTFGVMGRIVETDSDKMQDAAKFPEKKGFKLKTTKNYLISNHNPEFWIPSLYVHGANALIDRKKIFTLKGFDEIYSPFYMEDVDLSLRAWRLGWKCYYEHGSICRHPISATIGNYNKKKKIKTISLRNQLIFHEMHVEGMELWAWRAQVFVDFIFNAVTLKTYYCKAYILFWKKKGDILKSKRAFEKLLAAHQNRQSLPQIISSIEKQLKGLNFTKF